MARYCCKCEKRIGIFSAVYPIGEQIFCGECVNDASEANGASDAILISAHHVSANCIHISCEANYYPTKREIVSETTSTSDPVPRYKNFPVPDDVNTAEKLFDFAKSKIFWISSFRSIDDDLRRRLDAALKQSDTKRKP